MVFTCIKLGYYQSQDPAVFQESECADFGHSLFLPSIPLHSKSVNNKNYTLYRLRETSGLQKTKQKAGCGRESVFGGEVQEP